MFKRNFTTYRFPQSSTRVVNVIDFVSSQFHPLHLRMSPFRVGTLVPHMQESVGRPLACQPTVSLRFLATWLQLSQLEVGHQSLIGLLITVEMSVWLGWLQVPPMSSEWWPFLSLGRLLATVLRVNRDLPIRLSLVCHVCTCYCML